MSSIPSAREQKKAGRRNAQQLKVQQREQQDADYFWQCVRSEQNNRGQATSRPSQHELFAKQGSSGINFQQYDAIPVSRSGPDSAAIPQVENFNDLRAKLPNFLSTNLTSPDRMNYTTPTPIQRHCVPLSLSGTFDVMACAQTGSGKTVAFLVPLIAHISASRIVASKMPASNVSSGTATTPAVPEAVIVAPTRELAIQIELEAHKLTFSSDLRVVCVYGGAPTRGQLAMLAKGVDILVATPGRLNDFLQRGLVNLGQTKFFVLDEADRMLDMGFEPQIRQICEKYDLPPPHARRTLMFSATFPNEVQTIAQKYMRTYVFVAVGRVGSTIESITQRIVQSYANDKRTKLAILLPLLNLQDKTLIFCQKKHVASWVRGQIVREIPAARVDAIHGDRSQAQRESALEKFRDGCIDILVATDVAARGLDVPGITHVIQFDLPVSREDFDSYVHRIGRTGRAGRLGVATSLFVPGMDTKLGQNGGLWEPLHRLLEENNQDIPQWFEDLGSRKSQGALPSRDVPKGSGKLSKQQPQRDVRRSEEAVTTAETPMVSAFKPKGNKAKPLSASATGRTNGNDEIANGHKKELRSEGKARIKLAAQPASGRVVNMARPEQQTEMKSARTVSASAHEARQQPSQESALQKSLAVSGGVEVVMVIGAPVQAAAIRNVSSGPGSSRRRRGFKKAGV